MNSTDLSLQYLSIYDATTGERLTSYVVGLHGKNIEELKQLAQKNYPGKAYIEQDGKAWNEAVQKDLIYKDGKLVPRPAPTEAEIREEKLSKLDADYSQRISDVEGDMARAKAIDDEDYFNDLKEQREDLVNEYSKKRGEI